MRPSKIPLIGLTITPLRMGSRHQLYAEVILHHGYVPIGNQGDTVVLTSPCMILAYGYAFLSFNQIFKVSTVTLPD